MVELPPEETTENKQSAMVESSHIPPSTPVTPKHVGKLQEVRENLINMSAKRHAPLPAQLFNTDSSLEVIPANSQEGDTVILVPMEANLPKHETNAIDSVTDHIDNVVVSHLPVTVGASAANVMEDLHNSPTTIKKNKRVVAATVRTPVVKNKKQKSKPVWQDIPTYDTKP